jgi:DNA replication protein DnaC
MMGVSDVKFRTEQRTCELHGEYTATCFPLAKREMWSDCPACSEITRKAAEERRQREHAAEQAKNRQERIERNLQRIGIPHRFKTRTFDNFESDTAPKVEAIRVARDFVDRFSVHSDEGTTVVFSGRPGTGKSHLACAMATAIVSAGGTGLYATARELVLMLRDTWRDGADRTERQMLEMLVGIDILVIDEVGIGFGTEGEKTQFFDVIDGRYREQMPTILLTNLDKRGLSEYIGQRAFDRLREGGIWVAFDWDSYRGRKA